jgi:hypothetical protein
LWFINRDYHRFCPSTELRRLYLVTVRSLFLLLAALFAVPGNACPETVRPSDAIEPMAAGSINWTNGEIFASGIGAPPAQPVNPAQARAMAERAAFVVAIRNLLETVKGVRVDAETVVENLLTKSDVIRTRVDGIVKGARIIKIETLSDGSVELTVSMPMKGAFLNAVVPTSFGRVMTIPAPQQLSEPKYPKLPSEPVKPSLSDTTATKGTGVKPLPGAETPVSKLQIPKKSDQVRQEPSVPPAVPDAGATLAFTGGAATGLVVDGRGLGLRPALLPRIVDQQGREVYVGQVVTRTNAVEQGVAGYARDVNAAARNFRVTDNPAVIKGLGAAGAAGTDVVISQADAQALRQLSSKGEFLQYCRVIIVY